MLLLAASARITASHDLRCSTPAYLSYVIPLSSGCRCIEKKETKKRRWKGRGHKDVGEEEAVMSEEETESKEFRKD